MSSSTPVIHHLEPSSSSYASFRSSHLVPNTPCILSPKFVTDWPILNLAFNNDNDDDEPNYDYLTRTYGHLEVDCVTCDNSESESEAEINLPSTLGQLLKLWRTGNGHSLYLKDWHLPLHVDNSATIKGKEKGKDKVKNELYRPLELCLDDWMNELECNDHQNGGKRDDFRFVVSTSSLISSQSGRTNKGCEMQYAGGGNTFTPLHRDVCTFCFQLLFRFHTDRISSEQERMFRLLLFDFYSTLRSKTLVPFSSVLYSSSPTAPTRRESKRSWRRL